MVAKIFDNDAIIRYSVELYEEEEIMQTIRACLYEVSHLS